MPTVLLNHLKTSKNQSFSHGESKEKVKEMRESTNVTDRKIRAIFLDRFRTSQNWREFWWLMMMNCFCVVVDRWKAFSLIFSRYHWSSSLTALYWQRTSPSRNSDTTRAGFEPAQNLSSTQALLIQVVQ